MTSNSLSYSLLHDQQHKVILIVGPESPQMDGVATSGVALQGLEEQQPTEVAVCNEQENSVQEQESSVQGALR